MMHFSQGLLLGIVLTVAFLAVAWLTFRAGWRLERVLLVSYGVWGVGAAAILGLRKLVGL